MTKRSPTAACLDADTGIHAAFAVAVRVAVA
jgi:hypothetical protein